MNLLSMFNDLMKIRSEGPKHGPVSSENPDLQRIVRLAESTGGYVTPELVKVGLKLKNIATVRKRVNECGHLGYLEAVRKVAMIKGKVVETDYMPLPPLEVLTKLGIDVRKRIPSILKVTDKGRSVHGTRERGDEVTEHSDDDSEKEETP